MAKYRKKPVVIEARQFATNNEVGSPQMDSIVNWINQGRDSVGAWHNGTCIYIMTNEGEMRATVGDWIIKEPFPSGDRQFYPCKPDIFAETYEVAE